MIDDHLPAQLLVVLPEQIRQARVGRVALQVAVVDEGHQAVGKLGHGLRDGACVPRVQEGAGEANAIGRAGHVVTNRKDVKPEALMPEAGADGHQFKRIPEIRLTLGHYVRIVSDPALEQGYQQGRHEEPRAGQAGVAKVVGDEEPFEAGDVVHVHMGHEHRGV